jgi:hypothetical protein
MIRFALSVTAAFIGIVLVVAIFVLLIPFWVFNILVNTIHTVLSKRGTPWEKILQFRPKIGWQPSPNLKTRYFDRIGDCCSIITDDEGWPGQHSIDDSDIIVFGDSFAFGYGVNMNRAYYSRTNGLLIKPVGAPGYSMVQELMLMRRYAHRLRGKLVVWFVCVENDLAENLKAYNPRLYTTPFLRSKNGSDGWEIVSKHVEYNKWMYGDGDISNVTLFAHICTPSEYSKRVFSAVHHLIRSAREECEKVGAHLVVFSIPYKIQLSKAGLQKLNNLLKGRGTVDPAYPDYKLSEICTELNVPFVSGATHLSLKDYKLRDGHWNIRGNEKVARIIYDYYRNRFTPQQS